MACHGRDDSTVSRLGPNFTGFGRIGMGMPSYASVLTEQQLESVILYIKSLR